MVNIMENLVLKWESSDMCKRSSYEEWKELIKYQNMNNLQKYYLTGVCQNGQM